MLYYWQFPDNFIHQPGPSVLKIWVCGISGVEINRFYTFPRILFLNQRVTLNLVSNLFLLHIKVKFVSAFFSNNSFDIDLAVTLWKRYINLRDGLVIRRNSGPTQRFMSIPAVCNQQTRRMTGFRICGLRQCWCQVLTVCRDNNNNNQL